MHQQPCGQQEKTASKALTTQPCTLLDKVAESSLAAGDKLLSATTLLVAASGTHVCMRVYCVLVVNLMSPS
jgi:hypothetical protein